MPRGGARPGAGRPKGTINPATITKEQAREALRQHVLEHMAELVSAQVSNAKGLNYLVGRDKTGKFVRLTGDDFDKALAGESDYVLIEVWQKDPSVAAFTDLMNRSLDKPKEQPQELAITGTLDIVEARLHGARRRLVAA